MADALQEIIERLSQSLRRSVALDDSEMRLIAHSAHFGDADPARLNSLLGREAPGEVSEHLVSIGMRSWKTLQHVPARLDLGMEHGRICVPLQSHFELLGFMWVTEEEPVTGEEVEQIEEVATQLIRILSRVSQAQRKDDSTIQSLTLALLSLEKSVRHEAAEGLRDLGIFAGLSHFVAFVVSLPSSSTSSNDSNYELIHHAFSQATRARMKNSYALGISVPDSVIILGYRLPPTPEDAGAFARELTIELHRTGLYQRPLLIGVGSPVTDLEDIVVSYEQSLVATRIGANQGKMVTLWQEHPVESTLATLLAKEYDERMLPESVRALALLSTETLSVLEAFLDWGGNVSAIAGHLGLHRSTIHYRLNRFMDLTGFDLNDGETRLVIHLWLKGSGKT